MSELPSILVTDGWETDQNNKLVEIVIPSSVKTLQAPNKVVFMGAALNAIPSTVAALQSFEAPNLASLSSTQNNLFKNYTALQSVSLGATAIVYTGDYTGPFYGCTSLTSASFPNLVTISPTATGGGGLFYNCTALETVSMPKLTTISDSGGDGENGVFYHCVSLTTIELPLIQNIYIIRGSGTGTFNGCTSLSSVTLGSTGHPVNSIHTKTFKNCTQSGLTITIYTTNGTSLSGSPWGATNATIVYETA